jgi:hypothetical protein
MWSIMQDTKFSIKPLKPQESIVLLSKLISIDRCWKPIIR